MSDGARSSGTRPGNLAPLVRAVWRHDRRRVVLQVALLLGGGVLGGAGLVLLVPIVHSIGDPGAALRLPLVGETGLGVVPLWALLAMFVLLTALQALVTRTSTVNGARLQQGIADDLRHEAFVALLAAQWTFVIERRRSDIMQVITTGSARSASAVGFLMQGAVAAVLATVTAIAAVAVDPLVGVLAAGSVVVLGLVQGEGIRPAFRLGRLFGERNRHLQAVVLDSLDSLRLVRAHDAAAGWAERLADAFTGARRAQLATTERMSAVSAVSSVALAGSAAALVLTATWASVPPPEIAVMLLLTARLSSHTQAITRSATLLAEALPAVGDLTQLTVDARGRAELPVGTKPATRGPIPGNCVALVEFRAVTFHHGDTTNGVTDLDLVVPTGAITVLTGPSGSGKSTTADLVLGLLVAQTGAVCVAGAPLRAEELAWWRSHVAYVPQETVLVPGTLRENLLWSAVEAVDDDACWRALDQAAAGFARGLADGLDTVVGDRGIRLSGGERQRVAIARALLRRPALLVLDEATASLDDDTEAAVLGTLRALTPATTVLAIAHRRSTIDAADHVVRLQAGRRIGAG